MTQENLQAENAELKRKLAEAEKALADHRRDHETTMKVSRGRWREIVQLRKLREAAERERDEWKRRAGEASDYGASMLSAAMARTDERDEARRKCAELSEALRAWADELRAYVPHDKENGTAILVAKIEGIAALASQPAPEGKGEKGKPTHGEIEIAALSLLVDEAERILFARRENGGDYPALALALSRIEVRRLHKLTTPEAKPTRHDHWCDSQDGRGSLCNCKPTPEAP
jgi:hypothetical protein